MEMADDAVLKLHLEPAEPIEVAELTAALGSLARQYQSFVAHSPYGARAKEARLLVSNVSQGSIDISLVPDIVMVGSLFYPLIERAELVAKFGDHIARLIKYFLHHDDKPATAVSVEDCDDVINITKPIAHHGGTQTFVTVNGDLTVNLLTTGVTEAREAMENASREKARLHTPAIDRRERVPLVWTRLDRQEAKTEGVRSPDQGVIEEIDDKPHPVFFTDELSHLKREMIEHDENPYQIVYFVDVEVSRAKGRVASYRVVGYHGKTYLDEPDAEDANEDDV
jgi:hypothetical protein